jgi:hypothetical protein
MTGSISGPRRRSSSWLKISEDSREIDSDWRVRYREGLSLDPASARAVVAAPSFRIDNPDIPYAHATIIIEPLLITRDTIFGRQHLDNSQRSARGDLFDWLITRHQADVGNAESCGGNFDAQFRYRSDVPLLCMAGKPNCKGRLDGRMIEFAQVSLLQLAVDIVAVRTVAAVQVVLNAER